MGSATRFQLIYWPLPFRGCFVSYLFAYRDVPLAEITDIETIQALQQQTPADQPVPFIGPPILHDLETGLTLSQMPAIALYVSEELALLPATGSDLGKAMKVLMDCNDLLMEICRYNGTSMWNRDDWRAFRQERLPRWLQLFEASLERGFINSGPVNFADIGVYALFGNLIRCLPELQPDLVAHAPGIGALCADIGAQPTLAAFVAGHEAAYGDLYCGGQIEASIREMLALDAG